MVSSKSSALQLSVLVKRAEVKLMVMPSHKYAEAVAEDTEKYIIIDVNEGVSAIGRCTWLIRIILLVSDATTASFYSVHCPNECENFFGIL